MIEDLNDFNLDAEDDSDEETSQLDIDELKANLPSYKMDKICQIIVCNRYFGFNKDLTVYCMEELATRRAAGDPFNYEDYIESSFKELPILNVVLPDLRTMLTQVIGKKISK